MCLFTAGKKELLIFCFLCFFLAGCTTVPEKIGISNLEWTSYSEAKQQTLITNYERIKKEQAAERNAQKNREAVTDLHLVVSISGGTVMFPPAFITWQNYRPVIFKIVQDKCQTVEVLHVVDGGPKTNLDVCWRGNILFLDPSYYDFTKKMGSVTIHRSPLWLTGYSYRGISSSGYVNLNNVNIRIKQNANRA